MTKKSPVSCQTFSKLNATNTAATGQQLLPEPADTEELIPFARGIPDDENPLVIAQKYFVSLEGEPKVGQKWSWLNYRCFHQHNKDQKLFTHRASRCKSSSGVHLLLQWAASNPTLLISVGFTGPRPPLVLYTLIKKTPLWRMLTSIQGGKETKPPVGTLDWVTLFAPSHSRQSVFIYLQVEGVPFQILSLWRMQAPAGSRHLTLSLGLFVFAFQPSYHALCAQRIPWRVRLDQTTTCHTQQQIKAVRVSCR